MLTVLGISPNDTLSPHTPSVNIMALSWEAVVSETRSAREAGLSKVEPKLLGVPDKLPRNSTGLAKLVLSQRELEITGNYTITRLLAALRQRKLSVEEVTRAFLRRAALAQAAVSTRRLGRIPVGRKRELIRRHDLDQLPDWPHVGRGPRAGALPRFAARAKGRAFWAAHLHEGAPWHDRRQHHHFRILCLLGW
jgi:hypothetical protein